MPNSRLRNTNPSANAPSTPSARPRPTVAHHRRAPGGDPRGIGADRHAHAEFAGALRDRKGEHAIDADRGEREREQGEHADQLHRHAPPGQRMRDPLAIVRTSNSGRSGSNVRIMARSGSTSVCRIDRAAQSHESGCARRVGEIEVVGLLARIGGEIHVLGGADDADDRVEIRLARPAHVEPMADCVAGRKVLVREHLVDDDDLRRRVPVRARERAAVQQRNAHRLEIVLVDAEHVSVRRLRLLGVLRRCESSHRNSR